MRWRRSRSRSESSIPTLIRPLVRAERKRLTVMSVAAILGGFAEAGVLLLIARIAFGLTNPDKPIALSMGPLPTIHTDVPSLLVVAAVLLAVRIGLQIVQSVLAAQASVATVNRTRKQMVGLFLGAEWPLQAAQREGRLQDLLTSYSGATSGSVGAVAQGAVAGFNLSALLVTAVAVNAIASIGAALAALFIGLALRPMRAALRRRSARAAEANLDFATGITEMASALQEVRIFEVEPRIADRLGRLIDRQTQQALSTSYVSGAIAVLYQGIAMALIVGGLAIAYSVGTTGLASLGAIVLIVLRSLGYAQSVQNNVQYLSELAPLLETLRDEAERYCAAELSRAGRPLTRIGAIAFDGVGFEYDDGQPVLVDIDFSVTPGEIVGVVGPSGAGKSTLVQLLLRLREPTVGRILVDGEDSAQFTVDDWFHHVTFVPQEARLFAGTIAENIRFFRADIDDEAVRRAAKFAQLDADVQAMPQGYQTPVGERGSQLSGGQRQRVCIARALVDDPDVVVLDEVTASLDVRSEALIRQTIAELAPRATIFVIAHRLSTLAICNRIMVIMNGALEGFDTAEQLEQTNPFYAEALRLAGIS